MNNQDVTMGDLMSYRSSISHKCKINDCICQAKKLFGILRHFHESVLTISRGEPADKTDYFGNIFERNLLTSALKLSGC